MSATARTTILLVDADQALVRLIEKTLRRAGFAAASVSSGKDATEWLRSNRADLMLLDLKLQDMEAGELIGHLATAGRPIPFVIITGQGDERVAVDMMKRGALDYLVKDAQFLDVVPAFVGRAAAQVERERKLKTAEEALRLSEERFRVALKNSPILVFSQDLELRYTWIHNPPPGTTEQDFLGKRDEDLFPLDEANRLMQVKRGVLQTGVGNRYQLKYPLGSRPHVFDLTIEPVRDGAGKIVGITGAAMDITERKRLEEEISQISEMEQRRIGQDLHDGICQQLAGIELMSQVLEQNLEKKASSHAAQAGEIGKHVRDAIAATRSLARGLSPVVVESEGLMAALQELAENSEAIFKVTCHFRHDRPVLVCDNAVATHLYRIAQEAVSNAIRHGKAQRISISLTLSGDKLFLTVKDNGTGFNPDAPESRGMGLRIMQYRAGIMGGRLNVDSGKQGTRVICIIPRIIAESPKPTSP